MSSLFISESVRKGHIDKAYDQIFDTILDVCCKAVKMKSVACETMLLVVNVVMINCLTTYV